MARFLDSLDTAHKRQLAAEDIQSTFNAARHEAAEISHFLEAHYQDLPTELRPPPEYPSCALQVFHTPELLEQIFLELDLRSLLNASQTCKIMSVVIPASRRLQRALSMHPESDCFWHTSFRSHVLFPLECSWQHDYLEVAPGGSQKGMITVEMHEAFPVPRAGSRVRALYICQPPIHVLDMLIECCKINTAQTQYADEAFDYRISSPDGITVGDVLDMTQHLRKVHRDCPFAGRGMMNRDGTAKPRIWYSTPLDLPYDHPLLARRRTAKVKQPKSREQRVKDAEEALLKRYARYKKNCKRTTTSVANTS